MAVIEVSEGHGYYPDPAQEKRWQGSDATEATKEERAQHLEFLNSWVPPTKEHEFAMGARERETDRNARGLLLYPTGQDGQFVRVGVFFSRGRENEVGSIAAFKNCQT